MTDRWPSFHADMYGSPGTIADREAYANRLTMSRNMICPSGVAATMRYASETLTGSGCTGPGGTIRLLAIAYPLDCAAAAIPNFAATSPP